MPGDGGTPTAVSDTPEWQALVAEAGRIGGRHLRDFFTADPDRGETMAATAGDLYLDYAKQRVTAATVRLLVDLAVAAEVAGRRDAMFAGERINTTEDRAVLHVALRAPPGTVIAVEGEDVVPRVHVVIDAMASFAEAVRSGDRTGATGERFRTVVNLGIGGSDLGPAMATRALHRYARGDIDSRFVSNVDGADLAATLAVADPASTLFIVASKTFTTAETLANALSARKWLVDRLGEGAVASHFVALSTNEREVARFGIDPEVMFPFWDWVGGRYSLCSAIGLSLMVAIGPDRFREMLAGFRIIDEHFRTAPLDRNLPVLMALLGVWNRNFLGIPTLAVLPYSHELARFPAYLQQLDMESNGKSVRLDGSAVGFDTGPVVWGEPGTNGQHAFFQLIHQGTATVASDFIGLCRPVADPGGHHDKLTANLLAQAEALAFGRTTEEVLAEGAPPDLARHRTFPGNRPSSTILLEALHPSALGQLIALYEHKVFVQGVIWGVNSFDQWGVELGKVLATRIGDEIDAGEVAPGAHDSSTATLLRRYLDRRPAAEGPIDQGGGAP